MPIPEKSQTERNAHDGGGSPHRKDAILNGTTLAHASIKFTHLPLAALHGFHPLPLQCQGHAPHDTLPARLKGLFSHNAHTT